ncbi:MAG TPA: LPS export ABC transporter ATP-binding protein [Gammaproteobacteria bacterium]|nr:LPS export ABC transporter ATP-binding protein [Gammaproteobacteria bacterium]
MSELTAEGIGKQYGRRQVVRDVSLKIGLGEVVGLLGPNGAGKTTCFYMIVGLVPCSQGKLLLNNQNITHFPIHARARLGIGYLPQEASVFRKLSVEDNLLGVLQLRKELSRSERQSILEQLLEEFNLLHIRQSLGASLSGGERRRVEIARALASNPQFILLDEPFAGVDPISVMDIKSIIKQLSARHIGVLITDHNVRETLDICERAYIMNEGTVISQGVPEEIMRNQQVRDVYLGQTFRL